MTFSWLKRYMPRGLFGRATLILVLPMVLLQLVMSVVFVQRHFEGVTEQMTAAISGELDLLRAVPPDQAEAMGATLGIAVRRVSAEAVPEGHERPWFDLSGVVVIRMLEGLQPGLRVVSLAEEHVARLYFDLPGGATRDEAVEYAFDRARVSASNPHQLFVNMIVFGALLTGIAYLYLRNQLRPITRLAEAAAAFGRGRSVPFRPGGALEVREAGQAFVDMRTRIDRHIEQRTLMLSGVSHDLRTPLTRLRLGLSLLDAKDRAPLERDVDEMQEMIEGFLGFARGTAGDEPVPTDPLALVRDVVADAARGGRLVRLTAEDGAGTMDLRPVAIRRALENLIANAVRHGTRAEVTVRLADDALCIGVEDDGPGIPEADREAALRPFHRLDPARNQDGGGGVGLGLSIAADVARAHGGQLRLETGEKLGGLRAELVIAR